MTNSPFKDYPFMDCVRAAIPYMKAGHEVYQKFTCVKCMSRQTMDTPNVFFETGICEECGHTTNIKANGCNYLLHLKVKFTGGTSDA